MFACVLLTFVGPVALSDALVSHLAVDGAYFDPLQHAVSAYAIIHNARTRNGTLSSIIAKSAELYAFFLFMCLEANLYVPHAVAGINLNSTHFPSRARAKA